MGGPDIAPQTPQRSDRPGAAVTLLDFPRATGPRYRPPNPPTLGPPRRSRDAPRFPASHGAPISPPKPPNARTAPAEAWRSLDL
jgi:hypothetical protein